MYTYSQITRQNCLSNYCRVELCQFLMLSNSHNSDIFISFDDRLDRMRHVAIQFVAVLIMTSICLPVFPLDLQENWAITNAICLYGPTILCLVISRKHILILTIFSSLEISLLMIRGGKIEVEISKVSTMQFRELKASNDVKIQVVSITCNLLKRHRNIIYISESYT